MFPTQPWGSRAGFTTTGRYTTVNPHPTGCRPESHDCDTSGVRKSRPTLTAKSIYLDAVGRDPAEIGGCSLQDVSSIVYRGVNA